MNALADKNVYAVKHKDENIRMASRSGGVFTALTDIVLDAGGIVYGVKLDDRLHAVHARAETKAERDTFRGSKYVQSNVGSTFHDCKSDLENGRVVLFSGTPCQIDGLKNFLKATSTPTDQLIALEILCHGAPSPRVYRDYLTYMGKGEKITAIDFRNKVKYGWKDHVETVRMGDNSEKDSKVYTTLFYGHNILRLSCFQCPYKRIDRYADITIGDYWGIDSLDSSFNDNKGVSLVLVNSDKGSRLFNKASKMLSVETFRCSNSMQAALQGNYKLPSGRSHFWEDYELMRFSGIVKKYGINHKQAAKNAVKKMLRLG